MQKPGLALSLLVALVACSGETPEPTGAAPAPEPVAPAAPPTQAAPAQQDPEPNRATAIAVVEMVPTEGSDIVGSFTFAAEDGGVRLSGALSGLEPGSERGFHIHEFGDCSTADATSAGEHWNPLDDDHGLPSQGESHAGDMANVRADDSGNATIDYLLTGLEIDTGSDLDIVGRSVVVHAEADDYVSQPGGDAGERAACGIIELRVASEPLG